MCPLYKGDSNDSEQYRSASSRDSEHTDSRVGGGEEEMNFEVILNPGIHL